MLAEALKRHRTHLPHFPFIPIQESRNQLHPDKVDRFPHRFGGTVRQLPRRLPRGPRVQPGLLLQAPTEVGQETLRSAPQGPGDALPGQPFRSTIIPGGHSTDTPPAAEAAPSATGERRIPPRMEENEVRAPSAPPAGEERRRGEDPPAGEDSEVLHFLPREGGGSGFLPTLIRSPWDRPYQMDRQRNLNYRIADFRPLISNPTALHRLQSNPCLSPNINNLSYKQIVLINISNLSHKYDLILAKNLRLNFFDIIREVRVKTHIMFHKGFS